METSRDPGFSYRPALDGLRAFAVLSVFTYHLGYGWSAGGFLGVDTFFVLSGYLITSLLVVEFARIDRIRLGAFWLRRAKRLLPAIIVLLFVVGLYGRFFAESDRLDVLRRDSLFTLFYGANWHFIASGASYFDLFSEASPLRHMWSLAIEEQFYLVWPLVVFGCLKLAKGRHSLLVGVSIAGIVGSIVAMGALYESADPSRAYFGTDVRAHSLLIGALCAIALQHWRPAGRQVATLQVAGLIAGAAVLWSYAEVSDTGSSFYHGGAPLFAVLVAVVIAAAVQSGPSPLRAVLSPAPLRWVGRISYGVYLWHWPMIVWLTPARVHLHGLPLDVVRVAATFSVAALSFYLVECPIRFGELPPRRALVYAPAAMTLCAVVLVVSTVGATTNPLAVSRPISVDAVKDQAEKVGKIDDEVVEDVVEKVAPSTEGHAPPWVHKVSLLGDSVAFSFADGLTTVFGLEKVDFRSSAFPGCGIAAGFMLDVDGKPFKWSEACFTGTAGIQDSIAQNDRPDVVLWLSTWEMAGRRGPNGEWLKPQTPEHRAALLADIQASHDRLTANGAKLVFLAPAPSAASAIGSADLDPDGVSAYHRQLLSDFAHAHPDTTAFIDLAKYLCPDGTPCPEEIDGIRPRPKDGRHFDDEGALWLAFQVIQDLWKQLAPSN